MEHNTFITTASIYDFLPLTDRKAIRLVSIEPGEGKDDIHCTLKVTRSNFAFKYSALSYRWGSPSDTVPIVLEGQTFQVTTNLEAALRQLRKPSTREVLWIDALCINQEDDKEKSFQVSLMGSIYKEAQFVYVWLGKEEDGSARAMKFLEELNARNHKDNHIYDVRNNPSLFASAWKRIPTGKWIFEALANNRQLSEDLARLFRREYWQRAWVVQEVSLARNIVLCCGGFEIQNIMLDTAIDLLHRVQVDMPPGFTRIPESPFGMAHTRIWLNSRLPISLYRLLVMGQTLLAHDPRDRIYSVLGLVNDPGIPQFEIDYSMSPEMVYKELAAAIMSRPDQDFLSLVLSRPQSQENSPLFLPSWVPSWCTIYPTPLLSGSQDKDVYHAAGSSVASYSMSPDLDILSIDGFCVDTMGRLSGGLPTEALPPANGSLIPQDWTTFAHSFIDEDQSEGSIPKSARTNALSRVIIADRNFDDIRGTGRASASFYGAVVNIAYNAPYGTIEQSQAKKCRSAIFRTTFQRQLFLSKRGYIGLCPAEAREDDLLCILLGVRVPLVLRKQSEHYVIIGDCYIDGVMDGELIPEVEAGRFIIERFNIH